MLGAPKTFIASTDPVIAIVAVNRVVAIVAGHAVIADAAADDVVAFAAGDGVIAAIAEDLVIAAKAIDQVFATIAMDGISAGRADDGVIARAAADDHGGELADCFDVIVALAAADQNLLHRAQLEVLLLAVDLHNDIALALRDVDAVSAVAAGDFQDAFDQGGE